MLTRAHLQRWRAALRWRRLVDELLAPMGLTLTQWLVLEATFALTREHVDAVSQKQVGERAQLDKVTVSQRMLTLEQRGFVSRQPEFTGPANRVFVTAEGARVLSECQALVDAASVRTRESGRH